MITEVDGIQVHGAVGGVAWGDRTDPVAVLVHGAGMDATVWNLQTRYLGARGVRAVAVDLPGHGSTPGPVIDSVEAMGTFLVAYIDALDVGPVTVIGHSMGTFIAMEAAASRPDLIDAVVLMGTGAAMPVHPELLAAARDDVPRAAALMSGWSHDPGSKLGRNPAPGLWMAGGSQALIERSAPGVLSNDLEACNAYTRASATAAEVTCPVTVVMGTADKMTPRRSTAALLEVLPDATTVAIDGAGHMMMHEDPKMVRNVLAALL